jgi:hypothetical protein
MVPYIAASPSNIAFYVDQKIPKNNLILEIST